MSQENISVAEIQEDIRMGQGRENVKIAEAYLAAMHTRNIEAMGNTLHPDLHVVGPTGEVHNRASFLETMQKVVGNLDRIDVTARLASGNQTFYMYNLVFADPAASLRTASLITHHDDGQIKKIEMIADTTNFQNYLKNQK